MSSLSNLRLNVRTGPLKGRAIDMNTDRLTVGRDPSCDLKIDDPKLSRIHGFFEFVNGELYFRDNHSTNGSSINGEKVATRKLTVGDLIKLGGTEMALLEDSDFNTIQFVQSESMVTSVLNTASVSADALANKFSQIFDYYKDNQPEISPIEQVELVRTQRLVNSLKSLYGVTQKMSQLLPVHDLLEVIANGLFEVFGGAENLVILLYEEKKGQFLPRYASTRDGDKDEETTISTTVLNQAVKDKATLVANDIGSDSRFAASESIVGFAVKAVICAPLVVGDRVLGALYLDNRQRNIHYDDLDAEVVTAFANQAAIALDNARLCDNLQESYHQTLQALVKAIEAKDAYTMGHTQRVKKYSLGIAQEMGFEQDHLRKLEMAAELHDIGKIGIKEGIINKPGGLTDTEYSTIKAHVEMGEKILGPIGYLRELLPWIRGHHERWDGSGYPDGLKGDHCPLEARILGVADSFDAMTSKRSYNKPMTYNEALDRIKEGAGKTYDPEVVVAFETYVTELLRHTSGELGVDPTPSHTPSHYAAQPTAGIADPPTSQ
ncbi:HD domain-containing protein [bacterium]|nr:HD domain-containing protein [bacterium]